jgi:hypothetical protein
MASTTGIEIGPRSCTLVDVRPGGSGTAVVKTLHIIGRDEWPAHEAARADLLRSVRRTARLPHRAAVVAWDLPGAAGEGASAHAARRVIESAGFRIDRILSPPEALARVARQRRRQGAPDATVWTSLNLHGAAIAVVFGGDLLFARTFPWTYDPRVMDSRAVLLQRYSLIAHLGPEVRHGIDVVRASNGSTVDGVVTCGDLPELRSLTMPLIEELDVEVETLDSTEGLQAAGKVNAQRLMDAAPAIRLACAAALANAERGAAPRPPALAATMAQKEEPSALMRAATALVLTGALAWGVFSFRTVLMTPAVRPMPVADRRAPVLPPRAMRPSESPPPIVDRRGPAQAADERSESTPVSTVLSVSTTPQAPRQPSADAAPRTRAASRAPLKDPLPEVDSILIDQDRRLALIGGAVVGVGDPVGRRTVVGIDRDGVTLREPSGLVVRALVRSRRAS